MLLLPTFLFPCLSLSDRARAMWRSCLASAFRTALACSIVGCASLFGPAPLRRMIEFPAFSYATVIIVINGATLGDAVRGCWLAAHATVLGVCPAILSLWVMGPTRLSIGNIAAAVALSAFVVGLPEFTGVVGKRIALGQIVVVYLLALVKGGETDAVMHPVHVASSTAVGVLACVLGLLLPYPRLASYEVKKKCELFTEKASERVKLLVKAFCADDNASALGSLATAKHLSAAGAKLIHSVKHRQGTMQWERVPLKVFKPYHEKPGERLQCIELPLRGMEIAVTATLMLSADENHHQQQQLKRSVIQLEEHLVPALKQLDLNPSSPTDSSTVPESTIHNNNIYPTFSDNISTLFPSTLKHLPCFFFLFCMKLLHTESAQADSFVRPSKKEGTKDSGGQKWSLPELKPDRSRLMPALKSSLSLGLSVLFGMLYSKKNGIWAGLPVAITFSSARDATFKVANLKIQGTVLGTVYGVMGCFILQRFVNFWFLPLFPWFVFTSFLQRSLIYGPAGGLSAMISAVLILGRRNFGAPGDFAIARIVEIFIGLFSSVLVDIGLQPVRAATLAKAQLSKSLHALHDCILSLTLSPSMSDLDENRKTLQCHLNELGKFIGEAEAEPNFLFQPLHAAAYRRLLASLTKAGYLLAHAGHSCRFIGEGTIPKLDPSVRKIDEDLNVFKELLASLVKSLGEVAGIRSVAALEKELEKKKKKKDVGGCDLEQGKSAATEMCWLAGSSSGKGEEIVEKMIEGYLENGREIVGGVEEGAGEGEERRSVMMVLSLSGLGFCMSSLTREAIEMERAVKDIIVHSENPSNHQTLYDISCKAHALYN